MKQYHVIVRWHDGHQEGVYRADSFDDACEQARAAAGHPWRPGFQGVRVRTTSIVEVPE